MLPLILFLILEIKLDNMMGLIDAVMILLLFLILFELYAGYLNTLS